MPPALSVVITNHDYGHFLAEAIESALAQPGAEVVVVDDGSTDGSRDVLAAYAGAVVSVLQPNGGQASAVNAGFRASSGRVVALLDADDVLEAGVVEPLTRAIAGGVVHARWQLRTADARARPTGGLRPASLGRGGDLRAQVAARGPVFLQGTLPCGHAFSREFLRSALPMPTSPYRNGGVDLYLTWLAAASGPVAVVDRPLSRYRRHSTSDGISGSTDDRIGRGLRWTEHAFAAVADRLGLERDRTAAWAEQDWWHHIDAAREAVRRHVPADGRLLVADDYLWVVRDTFAGRRACQLAVDDEDVDRALVARMEHELRAGPVYLALADSSSWWLEHYPAWAAWITGRARLLHRGTAVTLYAAGGRA